MPADEAIKITYLSSMRDSGSQFNGKQNTHTKSKTCRGLTARDGFWDFLFRGCSVFKMDGKIKKKAFPAALMTHYKAIVEILCEIYSSN